MARQERRDADENGIGLSEAGEVGGGFEPTGSNQGGYPICREMPDVALAGGKPLHFVRVDIEPQNPKTHLPETHDSRQPNIPQADDADCVVSLSDAFFQMRDERYHRVSFLLTKREPSVAP